MHRVVIVGAGFGGLAAARALRDAPVDVDSDRRQQLPHVPAAAVPGGHRRPRRRRRRLRRAAASSGGRRNVTCAPGPGVAARPRRPHGHRRARGGTPLAYDTLVVAAGAVSPRLRRARRRRARHRPEGSRRRRGAAPRRARALRAGRRRPDELARRSLDVVVCGGGPTGVETAGGMMELFTKVLAKDFPDLDVRAGAGDRGGGAPPSARHVRAGEQRAGPPHAGAARRRGAPRRRRGPRERRRARRPRSSSPTAPACRPAWWCGPPASGRARWPRRSASSSAAAGGIVVGDDLSVPGHPEVFAVGDVAAAALPATSAAAAGRPAGDPGRPARRRARSCAASRGGPTEPFRYHDKGSMATIGRHDAVAELPGRHRASAGSSAGWPGSACTSCT